MAAYKSRLIQTINTMSLELSENVNSIHQRAESVDSANEPTESHSSRTMSKEVLVGLEKTVLDNVVSRFSFIGEHEIHGNWRRIFLFMIISIPVVTFSIFLWYFLTIACVTKSTTFLADSPNSILQDLINTENVQYCSSFFSVSYDPGKVSYAYDNDNDVTIFHYSSICCEVGRSFDASGNCAGVAPYFTDQCFEQKSPYNCLENVYSAPFIVQYAECTPFGIALSNSITYALYSVVITIYLYLAMRVAKKKGIRGLCSPSAWRSTVSNAKPDWMRKSYVAETV